MDITVSDVTPAGAQGVAPQFTLYPNPNDGMLHVSCSLEIPVNLKILDLEGRMIAGEYLFRKNCHRHSPCWHRVPIWSYRSII